MWLQVAILVASFILNAAIAAKPKGPKPTAFEDIDFPLCEEGESKGAVFGQCWSESWFVITVGNYRTKAIYSKGSKK